MTELRTEDRHEIHDVILKYCRGVDRGDAALVLSCYHPDAVDDHGSFFGPASDFVVSSCVPAFEAYDSMMHYVMNELVEFDGPDVAASEVYFVAYMRRHVDGANELQVMGGRYVDRFERRDGRWKIAHRVVVYEWGEARTPDGSFPPNVQLFEHGHRFDADVAYTRSASPDRTRR